MHSARVGFLAGTALALILTVSTTAFAAPQDYEAFVAPQPLNRDYSTPGSMPKPSASADDSVNFRGPLRPSVQAVPPETRASASPTDLPDAAHACAGFCSGPRTRPCAGDQGRARAVVQPSARARHATRGRAGKARFGGTRRRRSAKRRKRHRRRQQDSRDHRQQAIRAPGVAQARPRRHRRALSEGPQLPAALGVAGRAERARQRCARISEDDRCRRARSERLPDAAAQCRQRRGPGRGGAEVHRNASHLRASRHDRPRAFHAGEPEHRLQARLRPRARARVRSPHPTIFGKRWRSSIRRSRAIGRSRPSSRSSAKRRTTPRPTASRAARCCITRATAAATKR